MGLRLLPESILCSEIFQKIGMQQVLVNTDETNTGDFDSECWRLGFKCMWFQYMV